jgi:Acyl-CoA synthetases (AMP-forming)/AMP-acid ligases II
MDTSYIWLMVTNTFVFQGTTGLPKATLLNHHNTVNNMLSFGRRTELSEKVRHYHSASTIMFWYLWLHLRGYASVLGTRVISQVGESISYKV